MAILSEVARYPPLPAFSRGDEIMDTHFQNAKRQFGLPPPGEIFCDIFPFLCPPPPPPPQTTTTTFTTTFTTSTSDAPRTTSPATTDTPPPTQTPTQAETGRTETVVTATPKATPTATPTTESEQTTSATTTDQEETSSTSESSTSSESGTASIFSSSSSISSNVPGPILTASASLSTTVVETTQSSPSLSSTGGGAVPSAENSKTDGAERVPLIAGTVAGVAMLLVVSAVVFVCVRRRGKGSSLRRRDGGIGGDGSSSEFRPFMGLSPPSPSPTMQSFSATVITHRTAAEEGMGRDSGSNLYSSPPTESHNENLHQWVGSDGSQRMRQGREYGNGSGETSRRASRSGGDSGDDHDAPLSLPVHRQGYSRRSSTGEGDQYGRRHSGLSARSRGTSEITDPSYYAGYLEEDSNSRRDSAGALTTESERPLPSSRALSWHASRFSRSSEPEVPPLPSPPSFLTLLQSQRAHESAQSDESSRPAMVSVAPLRPQRRPLPHPAGRPEERLQEEMQFHSFATVALGHSPSGTQTGDDDEEVADDRETGPSRRDVESPPPVYRP